MPVRPSIPIEIKRRVLIESGHRCAIPQCQHSADIDLHHIIPWKTCQEHKFENLIALCPNCHRLVHGGNIDRKSLQQYKNNLLSGGNKDVVATINNIALDRSTFEKLKAAVPPSLYCEFKNSAFGDSQTMKFLEPIQNLLQLKDDSTFVFADQNFTNDLENLYKVSKLAIDYIRPFLQENNWGKIQIGPTEGSIAYDIDALSKWSSVITEATYKIFDFFEVYNLLVNKLTRSLA